MTRVTVTVRRTPEAEPELHDIRINGADPTFRIGTEQITGWAVSRVEPRLLDLLDVAAAIFAIDRKIMRGGKTRSGFGRGWERQFDVDIEVRDHAFWRRPDVHDCLARTVTFLTGDRVSFDFIPANGDTRQQDYLDFAASGAEAFSGDHVVLFSGGLDSLAGALEVLSHETGRVILVTHQSAQKIIPHQDRLAATLRERFPGRVSYVPVRAHFVNEKARETTQRSRSFLFAAFGHVIARIVGADRLHFFENGIVSQNLPISPQVVGTMATRTTHPQTLLLFEELLGLVRGATFLVRNRFEWLTKADVVSKIREHGASDLISDTVSCNQVWERSRAKTHCGSCSQCLDRRFGILAAGLGEADPDAIYEIPVLTGERAALREAALAQEWVRHALRLAEIPEVGFLERFGPGLSRIQRGHPDLDPREVLRRSHELQRRHGIAVHRVLTEALREHADEIVAGTLPETSLMRVAVADRTGGPEIARILDGEDRDSASDEPLVAPASESEDGGLQVRLSGIDGRQRVEVAGLGSVHGMPATPVFALAPTHAADRKDRLAPEQYRYTPAGVLSPQAGPTKAAVAQNVKRCRDQLAEFHQALHGSPPLEPILIQNRRNEGYRLDPHATIVGAAKGDPSG